MTDRMEEVRERLADIAADMIEPPHANTIGRDLKALLASEERMREAAEKLSAAISWLDDPFVDSTTPVQEIMSRIKFMRADAEIARSALEGEG